MAALLLHGAARRLGGSVLQRTKAAVTSPAVAEGRRRLVPRRMLSTGKHPDEAVRDGQLKKEALYDALAKADVTCKTPANMRMQQHLSAKITPRPGDPIWENYYSGRRTTRLFKKAGLISLAFTVPSCWEYCGEYCRGYLEDKNVAPAMRMEEEHEAIPRPI